VNGQNKVTTIISVAIAGIFEGYTYNITQQDAHHKHKRSSLLSHKFRVGKNARLVKSDQKRFSAADSSRWKSVNA
jgi:hypothetical protein